MQMTKKKRKNKLVRSPITYNFTRKYIYFYYAFFGYFYYYLCLLDE